MGHEPAAYSTVIRGKRVRRKDEGGRRKQICEGNLNLLGAFRLSGSLDHIRRNIKLYIVLDEILTLF